MPEPLYEANFNAWPLGAEILETLGTGSEVDASFFEDSWTYGLSAALERRRRRAEPAHDCNFAELDAANSWEWMETDTVMLSCWRPSVGSTPADAYASIWPRQTASDLPASYWHSAEEDSEEEEGETSPMTLERARTMLLREADSNGIQMKAAYRKLAARWHPDLVARGSEAERERAHECMVAINAAYSMVHSSSGAEV